METWQIILLLAGTNYVLGYIIIVSFFFLDWKRKGKFNVKLLLYGFIGAWFVLPSIIIKGCLDVVKYLYTIHKDGGFREHQLKEKRIQEEKAAREREHERMKEDYLAGRLKRSELPRIENGKDQFEFLSELGLSSGCNKPVGEIVYVENGYCKSLNDFFIRNKDFRLYRMYKFVYLPNLCHDLANGELLHYLYPDVGTDVRASINIDSSYPIQYLAYKEDAAKLNHGMMFFIENNENHGAKYIKGHYYPLEEGDDESVIAQLDAIAKEVHSDYGPGGLFYEEHKPEIKEGSTDEYADKLFPWVARDNEVAGIVKEIREKIDALKEMGIGEQLIMNLLKEKPTLSKLIITKDYRILLPDYNNMEIKMEPINKAVFLLFLRHPEGIVFKCLPDYRKELADIYQKIKPLGLNERAIQSIEDVTNPCLNSINEKCARIRGAFISRFNENLARHYYIYGERGEAKKITLPRDMVVWE